ncbi:integrase core domain-containing protein [Streptomyces gibsoniae]|uniref:Integrase core domain-containing protein n=1 Tax=Streptomyces gibsoniae TaxID=3075529 RepID=A0ABU2UA75_9ACTN|nr:integrase core domain-containing protein [Streptomyces sp. DSM 41699]MDT0469872.1 integrase core domain-containing protein [Streptomyces sp. DSM 41699]
MRHSRGGGSTCSVGSGPTWGQFLQAQTDGIIACDLFHVETAFLKRIYVLFFIEHGTRLVHGAGATAYPTGSWVAQQARNVVMNPGDRAEQMRFLIRDRDAKFTGVFDEVFTSLGARAIRTPVRAPRANAIAERWVGTVRRECTARLLIYNEQHLREALTAYERHYNTHRPHQARDRRPPQPLPAAPADLNHVRLTRRQAVDGLISEDRSAA